MKPKAFIYDISEATRGLKGDLIGSLNRIYGGNPHHDFYEGYSLEELLEWWVRVVIEDCFILTLDNTSVFKGSPRLKGLLLSLSPTRNHLLYRCLRVDFIQPNVLIRIDVIDDGATLVLVQVNNLLY